MTVDEVSEGGSFANPLRNELTEGDDYTQVGRECAEPGRGFGVSDLFGPVERHVLAQRDRGDGRRRRFTPASSPAVRLTHDTHDGVMAA